MEHKNELILNNDTLRRLIAAWVSQNLHIEIDPKDVRMFVADAEPYENECLARITLRPDCMEKRPTEA